MRAKTYLRQVNNLSFKISAKQKELDGLRQRMSGVGGMDYDKPKVKTSHSADMMGDRIIKYMELEEEIRSMIDELVTKRDLITNQIFALSDPRYVRVLTLRYVDGKQFQDIADEMNYTFRHIINLHNAALKTFERKYKEFL